MVDLEETDQESATIIQERFRNMYLPMDSNVVEVALLSLSYSKNRNPLATQKLLRDRTLLHRALWNLGRMGKTDRDGEPIRRLIKKLVSRVGPNLHARTDLVGPPFMVLARRISEPCIHNCSQGFDYEYWRQQVVEKWKGSFSRRILL
jgi:hypothetical protein